MGFPFIAPLKPKLKQKFEKREKDKNTIQKCMPFAFLTSAAVVVNGLKTKDDIISALKSGAGGKYNGCIIGNTTDISNLYQSAETIVGYELGGNSPIKVDGETGRKISVPIIESIEIDTDGGNNTLKTARVNVKVFSLKQLEMFELFFLRPSMRVVLEYGWNTDLVSQNKIGSYLWAKKGWSKWKDDYVALFSPKSDVAKEKSKYIQTIEDTDFDYDYMAGIVTNFTMSPSENGTYEVMIEVSSGNELQLWTTKKENKSSTTPTQPKNKLADYDSFLNKLRDECSIDAKVIDTFRDKPGAKPTAKKGKSVSTSTPPVDNTYKKEFFNFGAYNLTQKDITTSKTPYLSFRFIIDLFNKTKGQTIAYTFWEDAEKTKPVIPVQSRELIISTSEDLILPGLLPKVVASTNSKKQDFIKIDITNNAANKEKCYINGKSFNFEKSMKLFDWNSKKPLEKPNAITLYSDVAKEGKNSVELTSIGNLLNVFINYETFKSIWKNANINADIINGLLDTVNNNMFGLCSLELQTPAEGTSNFLEIIDIKLPIPNKEIENTESYRFKVGSIDSIVKDFKFNMELSTLAQAQALYATQLALSAKEKNFDEPFLETPNDAYSNANLAYATNADGYYSLNLVDAQIFKEADEVAVVKDDSKDDKEKNNEEEKKLTEVIAEKYVKFKIDPLNKKETSKNFIYRDSELVKRYLVPNSPAGTNALTYLDISLIIDGVSGLSCGEYFNISGVPETYNKNGFFQITNVKQSIGSGGWFTEIEAGYRIKDIA